jgi:hypothetical protein
MNRGRYINDLIPEGFMSRAQLADILNIRYHTVYMRERKGTLVPTATMDAGQLSVSLYAKADVESMVRAHAH